MYMCLSVYNLLALEEQYNKIISLGLPHQVPKSKTSKKNNGKRQGAKEKSLKLRYPAINY